MINKIIHGIIFLVVVMLSYVIMRNMLELHEAGIHNILVRIGIAAWAILYLAYPACLIVLAVIKIIKRRNPAFELALLALYGIAYVLLDKIKPNGYV